MTSIAQDPALEGKDKTARFKVKRKEKTRKTSLLIDCTILKIIYTSMQKKATGGGKKRFPAHFKEVQKRMDNYSGSIRINTPIYNPQYKRNLQSTIKFDTSTYNLKENYNLQSKGKLVKTRFTDDISHCP